MTQQTVSDVVAGRMLALRRNRGWSARQLAEECQAIGADQVTGDVIANIETGRRPSDSGRRRRDVTVDELALFAAALGVPPISLLIPTDIGPSVTVSSTVHAASDEFLLWVTGRSPLPELPMEPTRRRWFMEAAEPASLLQGLAAAKSAVLSESEKLRSAREAGNDYLVNKFQRSQSDAAQEVIETLERLLESDIQPPPVTRRLATLIEELGLAVPGGVTVLDVAPEESDGAR